ncbi:MAG: PAS domain-containing protein, partial [Myxococcota bacterium]
MRANPLRHAAGEAVNQQKDLAVQRALWRFFQGSDTPTVICAEDLSIIKANRAFGVRIGAKTEAALSGVPLEDVLSSTPALTEVLQDGGQVAVRLPGGKPALASLIRADELLLITLDAGLEGARLAEASRVLEEQSRVLEIGRLLSVLMTEEDLIGVVAEGLRQLFRGRQFAIRVVDPLTMELTGLYSEGPLLAGEPEVLTIKRSAVVKTGLPEVVLDNDKTAISEDYHRIFEGTETGICVPLTSGNQLFGMINLEGLAGQFLDIESDTRLLISLANHLAVAVRNARLLREARYLRGYLEKLIDNANALILVIDGQGRISVFNRAFQELSCFGREEVIGSAFLDLLAEEDRPAVGAVVAAAMKGQAATNVEASVMARDGRRIRVAFNTAAILDSEGRVESVIAIGHDLTRIWELERQVIQAEKLASLGQLSAAVVHELNNPLTSITVYAEYVRDRLMELGGERDVDKASRILESADRILKFTRNLVTYARPSEERFTRVDLRQVVEQSMKLCEHVIKERSVCMNMEWSDGLPHVEGNQGKLQQVFINLITNASHAVEDGGCISVSARRIDDAIEV